MKCRYCENELPKYIHGNRRYCDEDCYYFGKKFRSLTTYYVNCGISKELKRIERLLAYLYEEFGEKEIPKNFFGHKEMNWGFRTGIIRKGQLLYSIVGNYSYVVFTNNTFKIIKNEI